MSNKFGTYTTLLINKLTNPQMYHHVMYLPGAFDCAEYLMENYWDQLPRKVQCIAESILVNSGKYKTTE
jgi:hypothetical protein